MPSSAISLFPGTVFGLSVLTLRLGAFDMGRENMLNVFPTKHIPSSVLHESGWICKSLFLSIAGMAFGAGSGIAHRAVDAVMGPRTIQHETVVSEAVAAAPSPAMNSFSGSDACSIHSKAFQDVCIFSFSDPPFFCENLFSLFQNTGISSNI